LAGHVAHIGQVRNAHSILAGKPEGSNLEDSDVDDRIILN